SDDNDALYRDREEVEAWKKKDPLARLRSYLIENRLLTEEQEMKMDQEVVAELSWAVEQAEAAPDPENPLSHVYARPIEPSKPVTLPEPVPAGEQVNLITAINKTLHEILEAHPEAVVFGEDVARRKGGVFKA